MVKKNKRKKQKPEDDKVESKYEQSHGEPSNKKRKILLPIKTAEGLVSRSEDIDDSDQENTYGMSGRIFCLTLI